MIITDDSAFFFAMIFLVVTFLTVLISLRWVEDEVLPAGEYFACLCSQRPDAFHVCCERSGHDFSERKSFAIATLKHKSYGT